MDLLDEPGDAEPPADVAPSGVEPQAVAPQAPVAPLAPPMPMGSLPIDPGPPMMMAS